MKRRPSQFVCGVCELPVRWWSYGWKHSGGGGRTMGPAHRPRLMRRVTYEASLRSIVAEAVKEVRGMKQKVEGGLAEQTAKAPVSWRPEVYVQGEWGANALRFATEEEARESARELMGRWMLVQDFRAAPSQDPVNYRWEPGKGFNGNVALEAEARPDRDEAGIKSKA